MRATASRLIRIAIATGLFIGPVGCNAAAPPPAVETVGSLSASYHSIAVAPLKHDAPPEFAGVVGSDDDSVTETITTVTRAADAGGDAAELPEVNAKDQGLKVGGAR